MLFPRDLLRPNAIVLSHIYLDEGIWFNELLRRTGLPRRTVSLVLNELRERGIIETRKLDGGLSGNFLTDDSRGLVVEYMGRNVLETATDIGIYTKNDALLGYLRGGGELPKNQNMLGAIVDLYVNGLKEEGKSAPEIYETLTSQCNYSDKRAKETLAELFLEI